MGWLVLPAIVFTLALSVLVQFARRRELLHLSHRIADLEEAKKKGSHRARLQYPHVDLSRCIGCSTCIKACPEDGVLDLIHGQAVVIHGARCVGHGLCAKACPVGAVDLTLGDLSNRKDIPALTEEFEVKSIPGLFLAGEVTGFALIRTAITHGTAIADEVAHRVASLNGSRKNDDSDVFDLCIVGAGPAGIAASLQAKSHGLRCLTLEQDSLGGTVSKYPRRKLVMTQPVALPLYGKLKRTSYSKEELMELWSSLVTKYDLPIQTGEEFSGLNREDDGLIHLKTQRGEYRTRFACLALGRRGTPRKLGVPGEDLPKVAYNLIDAQSYQGRRILVVGGGDSAIEAALGLAEQPGNQVAISYRKAAFFRLKARNETRLLEAIQQKRMECIYESGVLEITNDTVRLKVTPENCEPFERTIENDDVFVMAGGIPPFKLLEESGVSFDPADRPSAPPLVEQSTGLMTALAVALMLSVFALAWVLVFKNYYSLARAMRPISGLHEALRPTSVFGISCGIAGTALIIVNLLYLVRRHPMAEWIPGSLRGWMVSHIVTGILALLLILLHGSMSPRNTLGGHATAALCFLVVTGAIGRYFYSIVPRAANGKELALDDLNNRIAAESEGWDRYGLAFGDEARTEIRALVAAGKWEGNFIQRLFALLKTQSAVRLTCKQLQQRGRNEGLSGDQLENLNALAHRAYRTALFSAHYEDLRGLLSSWRYFHRWVALLMVLLAAVHILTAIRYGKLFL